jgi:hypothetical protein
MSGVTKMCNGQNRGSCGDFGAEGVFADYGRAGEAGEVGRDGATASRRVGQCDGAAEHVAADDLPHPVGLLEDRAVR